MISSNTLRLGNINNTCNINRSNSNKKHLGDKHKVPIKCQMIQSQADNICMSQDIKSYKTGMMTEHDRSNEVLNGVISCLNLQKLANDCKEKETSMST